MFRGKLSDTVLNTLQVMNDHGRGHLLPPLLRCFELRQEAGPRQIEVTATSAVELRRSSRSASASWRPSCPGKQPLVELRSTRTLLGGLVCRSATTATTTRCGGTCGWCAQAVLERSERGWRAASRRHRD
jgi:F0F1-type ATP synthase delta subunit